MTANNNRNNNIDSRNFNMENRDNMSNRDSNMSDNRGNNVDNSMAYNIKNVKNSINESVNIDNLSDKFELFLEMDEYQFKHITKYESFKETECAICMEEYKGRDIIKSFYKCNHIFHKKCLLNWLKKNNKCPICNHDLSDDIK